jgi:hypothetical protein
MIRVRDANQVEIAIWNRPDPWGAGTGPIIVELSESTPPPILTNGILLEDNVYFLMMEDNTSYLLQEA